MESDFIFSSVTKVNSMCGSRHVSYSKHLKVGGEHLCSSLTFFEAGSLFPFECSVLCTLAYLAHKFLVNLLFLPRITIGALGVQVQAGVPSFMWFGASSL